MMIKNVFASNAWYIILLFVAIGDLVVPFLLAPFSGKYNHLTMVMSVLGILIVRYILYIAHG